MARTTPSPRAVHSVRYKAMLARLREARRHSGLTQTEVARILGRTQAFVSKCELGERRIDPIDLLDFARVYDRPIDFFLASSRGKAHA